MALNVFVIKKYAALIMAAFLPVLAYTIGMVFYGFWIGFGLLALFMIFSVLLCNKLLSNPFTAMIEGKGLLCLNIDSTGIIKPFILKVIQPYVTGKLENTPINDVYNRSTVLSLANPVTEGTATEEKEGGITLRINQDQFNQSRFGLYHYPTLIYNGQLKSLVTKDHLSEKEKSGFAEHGILYLNRKMEELTGVLRDFGRYVVELTKPKGSIFQNKWFWIVVIFVVIVLVLLVAPTIIKQFGGMAGTVGEQFNNMKDAAVIPR